MSRSHARPRVSLCESGLVPSFAITRDGVRVAYEQHGRGPPLVLIHGLGDDRTLWSPLVERFAPHFSCISLDLRGHGQTTGASDFDLFGLHRDVDAVVSELGVRRPLVLGHSLGGFVATTYAASQGAKVRATINVDQPLHLAPLASAVASYQSALQAGEIERVLMEVLDAIGLGPIPPALRSRLERTRAQLPKEVVLGVWGSLLQSDVGPLQQRVDDLLGRLVVPYLCLLGREDHAYAPWLRARVPHAELEGWGDLGHFLHLLEPDRFVRRVLAFAAGC